MRHQPGLTLCKRGKSQPQNHRAADRRHAIKAKPQRPETNRYFLVSGMKLAFARESAAPARRSHRPGRVRSERLCEFSSGCYCCTFLLYSRPSCSNFASDLCGAKGI